ncbi:MAG TPA: methyltransferase [Thermoanaerobaculia bacterium]
MSLATAPPTAEPAAAAPPASRRALAQMLVGNQVQQAIHVAARLGIADLLGDGPRSSGELAAAAGAHPGALYRLLRVLASFGVFAEDGERRFALTPLAELLRRDAPESMRALALWSGGVSYQTFGGLEHSVRTGAPAFEEIFGTGFFDYLAHDQEAGARFDDLMTWNTAPVAGVLARYDLAGVGTIVDVGGGRGVMLAAILSAHPAMRGVLVDHPRVLAGARSVLEAAGVADRCETVGADISRWVPPGGDAYLLKSIVHGLDDGEAARLLTLCRQAVRPGGRLLLVELVMQPGNDPGPAKLMDLLMLVGCHGRERSEEEYRELLAAAGFGFSGIAHTRYGYSVIEGRAA